MVFILVYFLFRFFDVIVELQFLYRIDFYVIEVVGEYYYNINDWRQGFDLFISYLKILVVRVLVFGSVIRMVFMWFQLIVFFVFIVWESGFFQWWVVNFVMNMYINEKKNQFVK